ncbi:Cyclin-dependent kinase C-2 [Hordeum vulgare]|nr:Cyclin-dependent kinase C-2 [Hordeum vulgare]
MVVAAPGQLNLDEFPSWGSRGVDCFEKLEQIGEGTYGQMIPHIIVLLVRLMRKWSATANPYNRGCDYITRYRDNDPSQVFSTQMGSSDQDTVVGREESEEMKRADT